MNFHFFFCGKLDFSPLFQVKLIDRNPNNFSGLITLKFFFKRVCVSQEIKVKITKKILTNQKS